jgi:hypothetical protein
VNLSFYYIKQNHYRDFPADSFEKNFFRTFSISITTDFGMTAMPLSSCALISALTQAKRYHYWQHQRWHYYQQWQSLY